MKEFFASEAQRNPWTPKKDGQVPPLLHRVNSLLSTKFASVAVRLAFIADHSQFLAQALNVLQSKETKLQLVV